MYNLVVVTRNKLVYKTKSQKNNKKNKVSALIELNIHMKATDIYSTEQQVMTNDMKEKDQSRK